MSEASSLKAALRSSLLPFWLVLALLPLGRASELGTLLCLFGCVMLFAREPHALSNHAGARLLLMLFAAYLLAALLSALDSVAPGRSWLTVAGILRYAPLGIYACFAIRRWPRLRAMYVASAIVVACWALDAWVQMFTGWSLGGQAAPHRISGIFGADNLKLGPVLASLSPFVVWAARERWGLRGMVAALLLLLGPILLSGSRAAWLTFALVVLAYAAFEARTLKRFALFCAGGLVALALAVGVAWQFSPRFEARVTRSMQVFSDSESGVNAALSGRLDIWGVAARMYAGHPINGVGVRGFRYAYPQYAPKNDHFVVSDEACGAHEGACHAHQLLLEVASETGTLGLLIWLAAAAVAVRAWRRVGSAARRRAFPATLALGVTLFPLNTHLAFYSAWWGLLFWWLLALWCAALFVVEESPGVVHGRS
ncbi:O-antigen ligase family protein [Oleiagrimonas sp. MCCC 1A03011]|uniref:O-antigen ligase family protein n=1 Tax=Oleiagrimonas sp. MCCC 1A03011 TaxID=1926883 RepID=UPI000DC5CF0B|nr:O-antigen ligase family protein [Oleiagrimonas sp. MCCC 1A03011]RAP56978.1 polymerase [Oleiagrimonas sp. MCCC 1A03011]